MRKTWQPNNPLQQTGHANEGCSFRWATAREVTTGPNRVAAGDRGRILSLRGMLSLQLPRHMCFVVRREAEVAREGVESNGRMG